MKSLKDIIIEKLKLNKSSELNNDDPNDLSTWKVGDILAGRFTYNMSTPYFYIIKKRTAKSFTVAELKAKLVSGSYNGRYTEVPIEPYTEIGKEKTARINKFGDLLIGKVKVRKWDGKPVEGDGLD